MDSCRSPKKLVPITKKVTVEPDGNLKKSVRIEEKDCNLDNSILKLPEIRRPHSPKPRKDGGENRDITDSDNSSRSGFRFSSKGDAPSPIGLGFIRRPQEVRERLKAGLFTSIHSNDDESEEENRIEEQEEPSSKLSLQIDRSGEKPSRVLTAVSSQVSAKDKQLKESLPCKAEKKPNKHVAKKTEEEDAKQRQKYKRFGEGKRYVHDEREKNVHEQVQFQEKCKKMASDNMEDIRRQEYIKDAFEERKLNKEMAKQEFAQKLLDKQEKEKKVQMQKYLTDAWDGQVEYKRHKKMEMDEIIKQGSDSLVESELLHRTKDVEKKKQKKEKQQQLSTQDKTEQNMRDQMIKQCEIYQSVGDANEGLQSAVVCKPSFDEVICKTSSACVKHEMKAPEKLNSLEECRKIVYDNLDDIKKKEAANFVLLEDRRFQQRAKQQLDQKFREEQERDKKAILKKSVSDTWDAQIQANKEKKKKKAQLERQQMAATMESDRLHQIKEIEMRRQKKEKNWNFFWRQDETQTNMEDQNKTVDDNLDDILRKEAAYDSFTKQKLCNSMAKEEVAKMLHEAHQQEKKTPKQKPLADKLFDRYHNKQEKKREMDRAERQGVLPGYRVEGIEASRQKKTPQQKLKTHEETEKHLGNSVIIQWEMHHSVSEQGRDVQYESGFQKYENDCDIPDKDRSREIRKKIVYNQLSHIKKEEAKKRAFMEDKLLKEKKQQESAEQKHQKLQKEKKAEAIKSLTNSWDSQIQRKRQEKKELCEIERKDMRTLMELERVCGGDKINISHPTLPERNTAKNCARRSVCSADIHHDAKSRPLLSRQKVSDSKPVRLPSLNSNTVYFAVGCKQDSERVRFPSISPPE